MAKEILIAESDKMIQEEFERIFETTDHHLFFTTNDQDALLRGRLFKPDLIIGGKRLCQTIRADQDLEEVPFIILLDMFEDLSEQEQKFLKPNGVLSRPLNENEVRGMVGHLSDGVREGAGEKSTAGGQTDWESLSDIETKKTDQKGEVSLDESWETDEEIIELLDVVEEPEPRMSIDDLAIHPKEDLIGDIAQIEPWETPAKEADGFEKTVVLSAEPEMKEIEETSLDLEEEEVQTEKGSPEGEFFEKIELEELLRKVEQFKPSIEKELMAEKDDHRIPGIVLEKAAPSLPKPDDRYNRLDEFEAALRREDMSEPADERPIQPMMHPEVPAEAPQWSSPEKAPVELELQELKDEEFPEVFLEELAEELKKLEEGEVIPEQAIDLAEVEMPAEEEVSDLLGEEVQPLPKPFEEARMEGPPSSFQAFTSMEEITELLGEEIEPLPEPLEEAGRMEPPPLVQALTPSEAMTPLEELVQEEKLMEPWERAHEAIEAPQRPQEEAPPLSMRLDRKIEEVIAKGVQEMMLDFMNNVIPEITTKMITLTMDRIERMVKEVVPDLAEKAIQEEIQRLQKEEKD